jgi:hypothetical protein
MKLIKWALSLFGPSKKAQEEAWPFPVVLGTPPAFEEEKPRKPKVAKATTRKAKPAAKPVAKKTTKAKKK